ncbi:MAG: type II methionyl aminopeptidase [Acidilobaceae archaeon]
MSFDINKLKLSGRIASTVRDYSIKLVKPGVRASEVCERLESYIIELGGYPAFPCNFSVNSVAAHYTPGLSDDVIVSERDIVKIDIGVHIDGHIADTAITIDLSGEYGKLIEASQRALETVTSIMKPYISLYEIGRTIESEIKALGYKPIRNLSGHNIGLYVVHAGLSIPNYADRTLYYTRIPPNTIIAIEPFATNGRGQVKEVLQVNIYSYTGRKPKIGLTSKENEILEYIIGRYKTLPFTPRWLKNISDQRELEEIIRTLRTKGVLHGYPILIEAGNGLVSQFEHTFYITENEVIVIT